MSEAFVGEVRIFGGNFAPNGWAFCNGQLLPISQHTGLFSLLGTNFGGDGRTTFALPDLRNRSPLGAGQGPGLTPRSVGETGGEETVALTEAEMPVHTHHVRVSTAASSVDFPQDSGHGVANVGRGHIYTFDDAHLVSMGEVLTSEGQGLPHNNRQPYLEVSFIIALQGIYPSRS